jgi:hypothetical protein
VTRAVPSEQRQRQAVAIYHCSVKAISRSGGRSATGAAAYRAGEKIVDIRTGLVHDYTRKAGVESTDIVLPDGAPTWATDRTKLWNAAELAEKRKDACVAREFEVALPSELSPSERRRLALDFAKEMANREGCAVDVAIHAPGKDGDNRNHHAHILRTTRKVEADGLGAKLDTEKAGRKRSDDLAAVRARWADLTNERLLDAGIDARVDHRSLAAQGIDREPSKHIGPAATAEERRIKEASRRRQESQKQHAEAAVKALEKELATARSTRLEDLPIETQTRVWDEFVTKIRSNRERELKRVEQKAVDRFARRAASVERLSKSRPKEPGGLFAALRRPAWNRAMQAWHKSLHRIQILEKQAMRLCSTVREAVERAGIWSRERASSEQPELAQRVAAHRDSEAKRKFESMLLEKDRLRQQKQGRSR